LSAKSYLLAVLGRGVDGGHNVAECYERGAYTRNMTGCLCTCASYKVY